MKGYMYILECADGSYYTGSTNELERRLQQHQMGEGSNYTKKRLPVDCYTLKNSKGLMMHFIVKSRFRNGAETRKRL